MTSQESLKLLKDNNLHPLDKIRENGGNHSHRASDNFFLFYWNTGKHFWNNLTTTTTTCTVCVKNEQHYVYMFFYEGIKVTLVFMHYALTYCFEGRVLLLSLVPPSVSALVINTHCASLFHIKIRELKAQTNSSISQRYCCCQCCHKDNESLSSEWHQPTNHAGQKHLFLFFFLKWIHNLDMKPRLASQLLVSPYRFNALSQTNGKHWNAQTIHPCLLLLLTILQP